MELAAGDTMEPLFSFGRPIMSTADVANLLGASDGSGDAAWPSWTDAAGMAAPAIPERPRARAPALPPALAAAAAVDPSGRVSPSTAIRQRALTFRPIPSILRQRRPGSAAPAAKPPPVQAEAEASGGDAAAAATPGPGDRDGPRGPPEPAAAAAGAETGGRQSVHKMARQKGVSSGRTYTSRYRGVHQTFPTRRWEAQFRRHGKPTSLGCFDSEEEAARAYDRMQLWYELSHEPKPSAASHHSGPLPIVGTSLLSGNAHLLRNLGCKLNFPAAEYNGELDELKRVSQEELISLLRRRGRSQAAAASAAALMQTADKEKEKEKDAR